MGDELFKGEGLFKIDRSTPNKKVLLSASYSVIEPLGLMHLATVAKQEGWEPKIVLGKEPLFQEIENAIEEFKPEFFGFTLYTGNHIIALDFIKKLKQQNNNLKIIIGGPHATAFPDQIYGYADYIVPSEGLNSFRRILRGEANPGVVHLTQLEPLPLPDRDSFYRDHPEHARNHIKNAITHTGCPFNCSYCYNSLQLKDIAHSLTAEQIECMGVALGPPGRLFPHSSRPVSEIIKEVDDILRIAPSTQLLFFQDDSFGADLDWLREFAEKHNSKIPFHIMTRFNYLDPKTPIGKERMELLKDAGCTGLTLAIESADPVIRIEILNKHMNEEAMFRVLEHANKLNFTIRTFSMLGLPYGATTTPTKMNVEADLETLELNVKLREKTNLPTVAWASILVPYPKTQIDLYCKKHGFYRGDHRDILKDSYRKGSVLKFAKKWIGPDLSPTKEDIWLSGEEEKNYKDKLDHLMRYFPIFAKFQKGHKLARSYLESGDLSPEGLNNAVRFHLYDYDLFKVKE
ncbi:B12-binding domain-containing radical SAM protein [Nanoarchaeota archaeon]